MKTYPWTGKFKTKEEVDNYFQDKKIQCLLCGKFFQRLSTHLIVKHFITVDDYRERYGLLWSKGLCSKNSSEKTRINMYNQLVTNEVTKKLMYGSPTKEHKKMLLSLKRRERPEFSLREQGNIAARNYGFKKPIYRDEKMIEEVLEMLKLKYSLRKIHIKLGICKDSLYNTIKKIPELKEAHIFNKKEKKEEELKKILNDINKIENSYK